MEIAGIGSGQITASADVTTAACVVWAITFTSGSDAGSVSLVDGGASGTEVWKVDGKATAAKDLTTHIAFTKPLKFGTSCYATLAGTGSAVCVEYELL